MASVRYSRVQLFVDHNGQDFYTTNESYKNFIDELKQNINYNIEKHTLVCIVAPDWKKYGHLYNCWVDTMEYFLDKFYDFNMQKIEKVIRDLGVDYKFEFDENTPYSFSVVVTSK